MTEEDQKTHSGKTLLNKKKRMHYPDNPNNPLESALPDYITVSRAAEMLGITFDTLLGYTERLPLFGDFLKVCYPTDSKLASEIVDAYDGALSTLKSFDNSATEEDILGLFGDWIKTWKARRKLDGETLINLEHSSNCWLEKELFNPIQPSVKTHCIEILFHSKLFVRNSDLQMVIKPNQTEHSEIKNTKWRKVTYLEKQNNDLQLIISTLWTFRDQKRLPSQRALKEYLLDRIGVERMDTSLERLIRQAINYTKNDK